MEKEKRISQAQRLDEKLVTEETAATACSFKFVRLEKQTNKQETKYMTFFAQVRAIFEGE